MSRTEEDSFQEMESGVSEGSPAEEEGEVEVQEEETNEFEPTTLPTTTTKRVAAASSSEPSPKRTAVSHKKSPARQLAPAISPRNQSDTSPKPFSTSYVLIEVPADGTAGSENQIYLVPKMAVKPNHTIIRQTVSIPAVEEEEEVSETESDVVEASSEMSELPDQSEEIDSLDYFTMHKKRLHLPPGWTLMVFPDFVAFLLQMPRVDLTQPLTGWISRSVCLSRDMKPLLKMHDVTVPTSLLKVLETPFTSAALSSLLESLATAKFCPGLGLEGSVVEAALNNLVVPFKAPDCAILVVRTQRRVRADRCPACLEARNHLLEKMKSS